MDDATLGSAITYVGLGLGLVLGLVPPLLFAWFGRRLWARLFLGLCRSTGPWGHGLKAGLSLFSGLMLSAAVGVFVPALWSPGAQLLCDGQLDLASQNYSYKPGQHGTSMNLTCTQEGGEQVRITIASIFVSALLYGVLLFLLLELLGFLLRMFRRDGPRSGGRSPPSSGVL